MSSYSFDDENRLTVIRKYISLYNKKKDEIEEENILLDSLMNSWMSAVRGSSEFLNSCPWDGAYRQQNIKKKKDREDFEYMKRVVAMMFMDDDIESQLKFKTIVYGKNLYIYEYTVGENTLLLQIPMRKYMTSKNAKDMLYGAFAVGYREAEHVDRFTTMSYAAKDIHDEIQHILDTNFYHGTENE